MLELDVRRTDTVAAPPTVELRPMRPDDWPAVAEIYWDGMRDGLATFETQVPTWEDWDANHLRDQPVLGVGRIPVRPRRRRGLEGRIACANAVFKDPRDLMPVQWREVADLHAREGRQTRPAQQS